LNKSSAINVISVGKASGMLINATLNMSSLKDITLFIPVFIGQHFRFWKEKMEDYHGAQRLLGYVLGQCQRPVAAIVAQPTQANDEHT
jgi:hypothetical protein